MKGEVNGEAVKLLRGRRVFPKNNGEVLKQRYEHWFLIYLYTIIYIILVIWRVFLNGEETKARMPEILHHFTLYFTVRKRMSRIWWKTTGSKRGVLRKELKTYVKRNRKTMNYMFDRLKALQDDAGLSL